MKVSELMTQPVLAMRRGDTVTDAVKFMSARNISGFLVVREEGQFGPLSELGVVTERDLVRKVVSNGKPLFRTTLEELMTAPIVTVDPSTDIMDAARLMNERRIRRVFVAEDDKVVGVVTQRDLLNAQNR